MSFIDEVYTNVKKTADIVGKKAGDGIEYSKLRLRISGLKDKLEKKYAQLGKAAYQIINTGGEFDDASKAVATDISRLLNELNAQKAHLDDMKGSYKCVICGAKNPKNADFCIKCGGKLEK